MFGHVERMDDYRMARSVLMAEVSGGLVRGGLRQQRNDGGGCATMPERVESRGTYVIE